MIKICDDCGFSFDIFKEGYTSEYVLVCGECWAIQQAKRALGGVLAR
jgi:hypothetical protein